MDSLNFYDIKAEKANAILRHNKLGRRMANLFRLFEALAVLVVLSRLSLTLPGAVKSSGGFLKGASVFLFSPRFVFFLGNLIVAVLFFNSRQFSPRDKGTKPSSSSSAHDDLYDEFVERSQKSQRAFRTKRTKSSSENNRSNDDNNNSLVIKRLERSDSSPVSKKPSTTARVLRRSQTQKNDTVVNKEIEVNEEDNLKRVLYPEDLMSGEEFRSKVEAFIARQQMFRSMEEEFSGDELD